MSYIIIYTFSKIFYIFKLRFQEFGRILNHKNKEILKVKNQYFLKRVE